MLDKELLIHLLMAEGLIAKGHLCPICGAEMSLTTYDDWSDGLKRECRRQDNGKRHKTEISSRKGSWVGNSKIKLEEIFKLTYCWCQNLDQVQIKHELGLASSTSVDWDSFCREGCEITLFHNSQKLGGEGKIVQIDESKFGKWKYHWGHNVEGQWVTMESRKITENVFWWQLRKETKLRFCRSFRSGLSQKQS